MGSSMVVTLGQHYNVRERPTVILYTYINRHAGPPDTTKTKDNIVHNYKGVVIIYDNNAIEPYNNRGLGSTVKRRGETHRYAVHSN